MHFHSLNEQILQKENRWFKYLIIHPVNCSKAREIQEVLLNKIANRTLGIQIFSLKTKCAVQFVFPVQLIQSKCCLHVYHFNVIQSFHIITQPLIG